MSNSIEELLNALGQSIANQLTAANDAAEAAQTELAQIKNGLRLIIGGAEPSNLTKVESTPDPIPSKKLASGLRKPRSGKSVPDDALIDVLSSDWATAAQIREMLLADGFTIAEGTVYNRMRKLAAARPNIETAAKPERWRLSHAIPTTTSNSFKAVHPEPKKVKKARLNAPTVSHSVAGNDNIHLHEPILHHGDCLAVMEIIPDQSVDLILADLPYGVTKKSYDKPIPMNRLWEAYRRIIKPTGNIVLFASQPFTTSLINAAPDLFKYPLVWEKPQATEFLRCRDRPLKSHEEILVFSPGTNVSENRSNRRATYNPQGVEYVKKSRKSQHSINYLSNLNSRAKEEIYEAMTNCPRSILRFAKDGAQKGEGHSFAKPVALLEYLIKTYSNNGEAVFDNTMGSGSTGVAALRTGRRFIGIEQDIKWFKLATKRISSELVEIVPKRVARNDVSSVEDGVETPDANTNLVSNTADPAPNTEAEAKLIRRPSYQSPGVKLYQGDCLNVMRTLPSGSVDLVFTSPPYNMGVGANGVKKNVFRGGLWKNAELANGYASYDDARDPDEYIQWQKNVLRECWRLLSPTGAIFYQHKPRGLNKTLQTPLDLNPGLPLRQIIIWNRKNGFSHNRCYFTSSHEWIVVFAKPDFHILEGRRQTVDVWDIDPERGNPHPAPFPVELPHTAIESTNAKVILDPFMGSGTTGVAAIRCGREFIGIELDPGYLAGAWDRIEADKLDRAA